MFKRILLATDFSDPSIAALNAALSLAKKSQAYIQAIHVLSYLEEIYDVSRYVVPDQEKQRSVLNQLGKFLPEQKYPHSGRDVLIGSSIVDEILKYARNQQYDLIVVGSHGRSDVSRFLLGSVAQKIIRSSEIPVLVVKDVKHSSADYQGFDRVLCPTDFSDSSMRSLDLAVRFANFLKADFHLIHVIDLPALEEAKKNYSARIPEGCELNVDMTLKKLIDRREFVGKATVATISGEPGREILNYAEANQMDFIVMAAHKKTGMERILIGSVTAHVVAHGGIPVITVSPSESSLEMRKK